jgi:hypothetical protein
MSNDTKATLSGGIASLGVAAVALNSQDDLSFYLGLVVSVATAVLGYVTNKK